MSPALAAKIDAPDPHHYTWTWREFRASKPCIDAYLWFKRHWPRRYLSTLTDWDLWALDEAAERLLAAPEGSSTEWLAEWCRDYAPELVPYCDDYSALAAVVRRARAPYRCPDTPDLLEAVT